MNREHPSALGGIIAGLFAAVAGGVLIALMTGADGLGLVWGVFLGIAAFYIGRTSTKLVLLIGMFSLFVLIVTIFYKQFF